VPTIYDPEALKRCTACGLDLPMKAFRRRVDLAHRPPYSRCRDYENRQRRASGRGRRERLNRKYGITPEELAALIEAQSGRCAACGIETEKLQIDHCHETGDVRGLLCGPCNSAAGRVADDPERLRAVADYLERKRAPGGALKR
jgi:hypothetical protein